MVELLLGDIPERSIFRQPMMRKPLAPYFQLTQGRLMVCGSLLARVVSSAVVFKMLLFLDHLYEEQIVPLIVFYLLNTDDNEKIGMLVCVHW